MGRVEKELSPLGGPSTKWRCNLLKASELMR